MHEPVIEQTLVQDEAVSAYSQRQRQALTRKAHEASTALLEEIASHLRPGITEAGLRETALSIMQRHGVTKHWHQPYIWFGPHTLLTFMSPKPDETRVLQAEDIAYIDLGPVIVVDGIEMEGDVGRTYVLGENPLFNALQEASERIFEDARQFWLEKHPTGIELYRHVHSLTQSAGFVFNLSQAGHLIGSFPHKGWRDGLETYPYVVEPGLWVLEIQIRHPVEPYGAFFEAVLLE